MGDKAGGRGARAGGAQWAEPSVGRREGDGAALKVADASLIHLETKTIEEVVLDRRAGAGKAGRGTALETMF